MENHEINASPEDQENVRPEERSETNAEENTYTPEEIEYADGEGTKLDEELGDEDEPLSDEEVAGLGAVPKPEDEQDNDSSSETGNAENDLFK